MNPVSKTQLEISDFIFIQQYSFSIKKIWFLFLFRMIKRAPTLITVDKNDIETEWKAVKENKTGKPELDTIMAEQLKSRDEVKQRIGLSQP